MVSVYVPVVSESPPIPLSEYSTFSSSSFFSVRFRRFRAVSSRFKASSISVSGFFFREFGVGPEEKTLRMSMSLGH